jgi:hypothetical protein
VHFKKTEDASNRMEIVPAGDLEQKKCEIKEGFENAGYTAHTIEEIISQFQEVVISEIDEFGQPWLQVVLGDGEHSLAIMDDESWEYC